MARNLERAPGEAIWTTRQRSAVSYPAEGNEQCFAVEDKSFWFAHRNRCILEALRQFPPPGTLVDIGGGNGYVARAVQESGTQVVLLEPGATGVAHALTRGVRHIVQGTLADVDFLPASIPAAGLFDVLEHLEDDGGFLRRVNELQPAGGRLYITAPAHSWLWSKEDELAGHWRRYSLDGLRRLAAGAGYEVEYATYFFGFLVAPILLLRTVPGRLGFGLKQETEKTVQADHAVRSALGRKFLRRMMAREQARSEAGKTMRTGGSCLMVARKPG